jgi:hypothetical protein
MLKGLVIPFDRPVQVGACSIVGHFVIPGREQNERTRMTSHVSTNPVLEPLATESLWPCGSAR